MKNLFSFLVLTALFSFCEFAYSQTKVFSHPDKIIHISPQDSSFAFGWDVNTTSCIVKGRFNNDNYDDILVGAIFGKNALNQTVTKTYIYYGTANGADLLNPTIINGTYVVDNSNWDAYSKTVGDFNNDGYDDIAIGIPTYQRNGTTARGYTFIIFSKPDGSGLDTANRLNIIGYTSTGIFGQDVRTADINGDGVDDLLIAAPYEQGNYEGRIYIYYGRTGFNGTFDKVIFKTGGQMNRLRWCGDVNNDGYDDIITLDETTWDWSTYRMNVYMGALNIQQQPQETKSLPYSNWSVVGDINNDGYADVITSFSNSPKLELVKGKSSFSLTDTIKYNNVGSDIALSEISDANNDGINDLFLSTTSSDGTKSYIFSGSTSAYLNFSDTLCKFIDSDNTYGKSITNLVSADCNGDGKPEFYGYSQMMPYKGVIFVYENLPNAVLPPVVTSGTSCGPGSVTLTASGATGTGQYKWYASPTSPTVISTGPNYTTPILTHDSTFYVSIDSAGFQSVRVAALASVYPLPLNLGQSTGLLPSVQTGLIAYYPFNGNANDESGNGNNGFVNGATLTTDKCGNANSAYSFNGVSNWIEVQNDTNFNFGSSIDFTYSFWIKYSNSLSVSGIVGKENTTPQASGCQIMLISNKARMDFMTSSPTQIDFLSKTPLNNDIWHFVVFTATRNTNQCRFYVDGLIDSTLTSSNLSLGNVTNSSSLKIGVERMFYNYFNGKLDDIRIYNRALTLEEVVSLYAGSCKVLTAGLSSDSICSGSNTSLFIQNSQSDVSYQLISGGTNYGSPQVGNGDTLTFAINGLTQTTSLTILATDTTTSCYDTLDSIFTVHLNPLPNNIGQSSALSSLQNGLVAYYPFNGNANDESGNGNNGVVNGPILTFNRCGIANKAYNFDGINDNILINSSPKLDLHSSLSLVAWFKADVSNLGDQHQLTWRGDSQFAHDPYSLCFTNANIGFRRDVNTGITVNQIVSNASSLDFSLFHLAVGTYDSLTGAMSLFIDGILKPNSIYQVNAFILHQLSGIRLVL